MSLEKPPVEYRWALDSNNRPVPITAAERGGEYSCPLCRNPMIARLGTHLQHHFSHQSANLCDSEAVSIAALRQWLAMNLQDALNRARKLQVRWRCKRCGQIHTRSLLESVSTVLADVLNAPEAPDVTLFDDSGRPRAHFFIMGKADGTPHAMHELARDNLFGFTVPSDLLPDQSDVKAIFPKLTLHTAPCPYWEGTTALHEPNAVRDAICTTLNAVGKTFASPVGKMNSLNDLAQIGTNLVWATADFWRETIGGTRNRIAGMEILLQQWKQDDGGLMQLYYVTIRNDRAIGGRRYPAGVIPNIEFDDRLRRRRTTALEVVRFLVSKES